MGGDLSLLANNLVELANVRGELEHLTANSCGTRLYDARCGWGRLWYLWGRVWQLLSWLLPLPPSEPQQLVLKALQKSNRIFQQELLYAQQAADIYHSHICAAAEDRLSTYSEIEVDTAEGMLTSWHQVTSYLKEKYIPGDIITQHFALDDKIKKKLKRCQAIIDLQDIMEVRRPLPFSRLRTAIIDPKQPVDLGLWCRELNDVRETEEQNEEKELICSLHKALSALVYFFSPSEKMQEQRLALAGLEAQLIEKGCTVFAQNEKKLCDRMVKLQKGETFTLLDGKKFILDERIDGEQRKDFVVFALRKSDEVAAGHKIEGDPHMQSIIAPRDRVKRDEPLHLELLITNNRARIGLELYRNGQQQGCAPRCRDVDMSNTPSWCALTASFQNVVPPINPQQSITLIACIKSWIDKNTIPTPLNIGSIGWDYSGNIRSRYALDGIPFDCSTVEQFLWDCTGGNQPKFSDMMQKSGLKSHYQAQFYCAAIKGAIEQGCPDCSEMAKYRAIPDSKHAALAKDLCNKAIELRDAVLRTLLSPTFPQKEKDKKMVAEVNKIFLNLHSSWCICSILPPEFKKKIEATVLEQTRNILDTNSFSNCLTT